MHRQLLPTSKKSRLQQQTGRINLFALKPYAQHQLPKKYAFYKIIDRIRPAKKNDCNSGNQPIMGRHRRESRSDYRLFFLPFFARVHGELAAEATNLVHCPFFFRY